MNDKIAVVIQNEEAAYLERLWFEYQAALSIIRYLTTQDGVKEEYLDRYTKAHDEKFATFEISKQEVLDKYKPEGVEKYNYFIDFNKAEVTYTPTNA